MELIVKLYNSKPVRIGVHFESQFKASKEYQEILEKLPGETFQATFEIGQEGLTLTLKSDASKGRLEYRGLGYKLEQLKKLQTLIKPGSPIEFVHVYGTYDNLYVAKPITLKMEFVAISGIQIISNED